MATYSDNTTMKVNRALVGGETVNANAYAECTYNASAISGTVSTTAALLPVQRIFGPGQSVPASFTVIVADAAGNKTATYNLISGVEFINTP